MANIPTMPEWPVLIQYANDPEMDLIDSDLAWQRRDDIRASGLQPDDRIIDSHGWVFYLPAGMSGMHYPVCSGQQIELETLLGLIKAHMSACGACCVAKLYAPGYREAFEIIIDAGKPAG